MLFDLRSPHRRNLIRVVYAFLAVLMGGGLILFGIGGAGGGLFSDVGGGGGGGGGNPFEDDISNAEAKLQQNPQDPAALAQLVQLHYQAGNQQVDENGQLTSDGEEQLLQGADAWAKYLKLSGGNPAPTPTLLAVQTLARLAQDQLGKAQSASTLSDSLSKATSSTANWSAAAEAQRLLLEKQVQQQGSTGYQNLATFLYAAGDVQGGDQAAQQALQQVQASERSTIKANLDSIKKQAAKINAAIVQLEKQQTQTQQATGGANPLETLGGGGLSTGGGLSGQ